MPTACAVARTSARLSVIQSAYAWSVSRSSTYRSRAARSRWGSSAARASRAAASNSRASTPTRQWEQSTTSSCSIVRQGVTLGLAERAPGDVQRLVQVVGTRADVDVAPQPLDHLLAVHPLAGGQRQHRHQRAGLPQPPAPGADARPTHLDAEAPQDVDPHPSWSRVFPRHRH